MLKHTIKLKNGNNESLPSLADVFLGYICPECNSEIWIRASEAQIQTHLECLGCGYHLRITRLIDICVSYSMQAKVVQQIPPHIKNAIKILKGWGFSRKDALQHIKSVPNYKTITDVNLLVRRTLESIPPSQS